jgi:hypothetical protein
VKQFDSLKVSIGKLEFFKDIDFFSWFLLNKMQDSSLKLFKVVKLGDNMIVPVHVQDKSQKVEIECKSVHFKTIG